MQVEYKDLPELREKFRHKKIVFCSGSFDLTHVGHLLFFEDCKKHGNLLFVSIGSDALIKQSKGNSRPILNEYVRMKMVDSLKPVDYCFLDNVLDERNNYHGLKLAFEKLRPDVYVINSDVSNLNYREDLCKEYGIKLVILERTCPKKFDNISTTQIIKKIKDLSPEQ